MNKQLRTCTHNELPTLYSQVILLECEATELRKLAAQQAEEEYWSV